MCPRYKIRRYRRRNRNFRFSAYEGIYGYWKGNGLNVFLIFYPIPNRKLIWGKFISSYLDLWLKRVVSSGLSQAGGLHYAHHITTCRPRFSDLATALIFSSGLAQVALVTFVAPEFSFFFLFFFCEISNTDYCLLNQVEVWFLCEMK